MSQKSFPLEWQHIDPVFGREMNLIFTQLDLLSSAVTVKELLTSVSSQMCKTLITKSYDHAVPQGNTKLCKPNQTAKERLQLYTKMTINTLIPSVTNKCHLSGLLSPVVYLKAPFQIPNYCPCFLITQVYFQKTKHPSPLLLYAAIESK